jgi:hypothetical protein
MSAKELRVEIGAVLAAWDQACVIRSGLHAGTDPGEGAEAAARIAEAATLYGPDQLGRGTVVLLTRAVDGFCASVAAGRRAQITHKFTVALTDKLNVLAGTWPELVEVADLPMVRKVVDLAVAGRTDPLAWRDRAGPTPDSEHRAMTAALALTAEFVDMVDGPGICGQRLLAALDGALD